MGFCDGNGNVLGSRAEIIGHDKKECENILPGDQTATDFMEVLSKRMVSHYYMTIIQLGDALMKQRVVTGDRACRELIEGCISRAPVNSLNVYCPCHTDPMKAEIEKAIADQTAGDDQCRTCCRRGRKVFQMEDGKPMCFECADWAAGKNQ